VKSTNTMIHYHLGGGLHPDGGSVIGLQIMVDDAGAEFVQFGGDWVHVDEVPLPKLHRAAIESGVPTPKRVPTTGLVPQVPSGDAFVQQGRAATVLHPDSPVK
jgi:hypothetical protein